MIELMKNPETLREMSMGTKMLGSLNVALLGLGTCFVVLAILILCISIMHKSEEKRALAAASAAPAIADAPAAKIAAPEVTAAAPALAAANGTASAAELDPAIVAAITVAIAKHRGASKGGFRIVNIVPAEIKSGWKNVGKTRAFAKRGSRL